MKIKDLAKIEKTDEEHKGAGHRKRLRERFLNAGLDGFLDYEIIELLLTLGTPRKDCKPMAKDALKEFKGLQGVLDVSLDDLQKIKGIGPTNAFGIKLFQAVSEQYAKKRIPKKVLLNSSKRVADYLQEKLGRKKKEYLYGFYLNSRNKLIHEEVISLGTLTTNLVHPREVFKPAVKFSAVAIILAHNHPSGDPRPSEDDIKITQQLIKASKLINIEILDHIIIGKNKYISLKDKKII